MENTSSRMQVCCWDKTLTRNWHATSGTKISTWLSQQSCQRQHKCNCTCIVQYVLAHWPWIVGTLRGMIVNLISFTQVFAEDGWLISCKYGMEHIFTVSWNSVALTWKVTNGGVKNEKRKLEVRERLWAIPPNLYLFCPQDITCINMHEKYLYNIL